MVIRDEYLTGSQTVVKKLDWLQENGWDQVWRARGDGDCFYRCTLGPRSSLETCYSRAVADGRYTAFTIAYILKILHSSDPASSSKAALEAIQRATPSETTHFDPELVRPFTPRLCVCVWLTIVVQYQEFLDPFIDIVRSFQKDKTSRPAQWDIIQLLQDAERSNCIVVVRSLLRSLVLPPSLCC